MKKFILTALFIFLSFSVSYGAVSQDVNIYVRQDVFDAKMEALFNKLHGEIETLSERMDKNFAEFKALVNEIKGDIKTLDARVSGIENHISWWIGGLTLLLTTIALLPLLSKFFERFMNEVFESRKHPPLTVEDVRRIVLEMQMSTKPQV
ncbi:MAG: hypothetical protein IJQ99_07710 [Synergistaceae bacterium]|nr:hypothetical protein [Synergistaceae bacterium]